MVAGAYRSSCSLWPRPRPSQKSPPSPPKKMPQFPPKMPNSPQKMPHSPKKMPHSPNTPRCPFHAPPKPTHPPVFRHEEQAVGVHHEGKIDLLRRLEDVLHRLRQHRVASQPRADDERVHARQPLGHLRRGVLRRLGSQRRRVWGLAALNVSMRACQRRRSVSFSVLREGFIIDDTK